MGDISFYGPLFDGAKVTDSIRAASTQTQSYALKVLRGNTPVDTGYLKSQWQVSLEAQGLRLINDARYATFVELGTQKMKGRRMVERSLPEIQDYFTKALGRELGKKLAAKVIGDIRAEVNPGNIQNYDLQSTGGFKSPKTVRSKSFGKVAPRGFG